LKNIKETEKRKKEKIVFFKKEKNLMKKNIPISIEFEIWIKLKLNTEVRKKKTFSYPKLQKDGTYKLVSTVFKEAYPSDTLTILNSKIKNYIVSLLYYILKFKDW
jgi:hypothetical protein